MRQKFNDLLEWRLLEEVEEIPNVHRRLKLLVEMRKDSAPGLGEKFGDALTLQAVPGRVQSWSEDG